MPNAQARVRGLSHHRGYASGFNRAADRLEGACQGHLLRYHPGLMCWATRDRREDDKRLVAAVR